MGGSLFPFYTPGDFFFVGPAFYIFQLEKEVITSMQNVIELEDITAAYNRQPVLWDLDLNIPKGTLMGIVGPNGAGKSTLLKIILNLLIPVSGRLRFSIDGEESPKKARKKIAYVPQNGSVNWDFPAQKASVYLLDEPFKGVDAQTEKVIVTLLKEMQSQGKTIVVVHHALQTVSQYFDRVAMINRQLVAEGPVADIFTRENIEKTFSPLSKESESDGNT